MILQVADSHDQADQLPDHHHHFRQHNQASSRISQCPDSLARWYCLNGATCFSVLAGESVLYNCWCRSGFHGARCDFKYTSGAARVARPLRNNPGPNQTTPTTMLEFMGASSDHMAALGLSGGDLISHARSGTTSGQDGRQITVPIEQQASANGLALVCCLILLLVIALCALLIQRFCLGDEQPPVGRRSRAMFRGLTLGWAGMQGPQFAQEMNRWKRPAAGRQVVAQMGPIDKQQVARKWDDALGIERGDQSGYNRAHAIELARQATHWDARDWDCRPAVAAVQQTGERPFVRQSPPVRSMMRAQIEQQRHQQVAEGQVISWPASGDDTARGSSLEAAQV